MSLADIAKLTFSIVGCGAATSKEKTGAAARARTEVRKLEALAKSYNQLVSAHGSNLRRTEVDIQLLVAAVSASEGDANPPFPWIDVVVERNGAYGGMQPVQVC